MRSLIIAFLLCFTFSFCLGTDEVQLRTNPSWLHTVKPDLDKKPADKKISNGYYLELYDQQVNLVTNTRYIHGIRNIVNETGVQNASEVSVSFSPQYQKVVFHMVSLIREGKVITKLQPSQIRTVDEESEASEFLYYGQKRAFVILKDVRKNDRIEFAYSITGFNPVFKNKYSDKIYFTSGTAICNYFETIIAPATRKLHFRPFNGAPEPAIEMIGNTNIYHWSNPPTRVWESQQGAPSWYDNHPYISITEYNNWQEVITWGMGLFNNYQHRLPEGLQQKIGEWRKTTKGDKEQFAILAIRFVQDQIRYLGMEIGENTHKPHAPAEVFQHSYGDCKDKSLLLSMILQNENIPAFVAMLSTTKKEAMAKAPPGPEEFDHAIVAIQRSSGYVYVDPTISQQRGELVNLYIPAYRYALVIREGETKLQLIEPDAFNVTRIDEKLKVNILDSSRFEVVTFYQGGKADDIRRSLSAMSTTELEENYVDYYAKSFDEIQLAGPILVKDDSSKNELTVSESYSIPAIWSTNAEGHEAFEIFARSMYEIIPDAGDAAKNAPMALNFPSTTYYTLSLEMPENWEFPLAELHIKNSSYQFDYTPKVSGNIITLCYTFKTLKDHIAIDELNRYKTDYKKIVKKLSFELLRPNPMTPSKNHFGGGVNWFAVWLSFGMMMGLSFLFRYLDKQNVSAYDDTKRGWRIGSWLVLLGISLVLTCIVQLIDIATDNYFNHAVWLALGEDGGAALQSVAIFELAFGMIGLAGGSACFYWFIRRRDIFPRMFMGYVASILLGEIVLLALYSYVPYPASYGDLGVMIGAQLFRTFPYALIWVAYILKSERAKNTFVKTG